MKFSIVTPTFRQLDWLKLCVASVADQKGDFDIEHLIQDGGSGADFEQWASENAPSGWVSEADHGMYDAINRGFRRANGDVLAWLNSDEQYLPGALQKVSQAFEANPDCDLIFGDVAVTNSEGNLVCYRRALVPSQSFIRYCFLPTFSAATFVRRSLIDSCGLLDTRWRAIADAVWVEKLLGKANPLVLNVPLAIFTQTGENLGMTSGAGKELARWRSECGTGGRLKREILSMGHRLRKLAANGYTSRKRSIQLHLPGSEGRTTRSAAVSERWPKKLGVSYYAEERKS